MSSKSFKFTATVLFRCLSVDMATIYIEPRSAWPPTDQCDENERKKIDRASCTQLCVREPGSELLGVRFTKTPLKFLGLHYQIIPFLGGVGFPPRLSPCYLGILIRSKYIKYGSKPSYLATDLRRRALHPQCRLCSCVCVDLFE